MKHITILLTTLLFYRLVMQVIHKKNLTECLQKLDHYRNQWYFKHIHAGSLC